LYLDQPDRGPLFGLSKEREDEKKIIFITPKSSYCSKYLDQQFGGTSHQKVKEGYEKLSKKNPNYCSKKNLETVTFFWIDPKRYVGKALIQEIDLAFKGKV
jgi:hypothetical protein